MRIDSLQDLVPAANRVVVVNVATDLVATRALLSAITFCDIPVLLLNCEPSHASRDHSDALMEHFRFDLLEVPLRLHGDQLDALFSQTADERIMLLDSDAEIRDAGFVAWMRAMMDLPAVFGAGFLEGPFWIPESWKAPPRSLLYMQRPWMPCVMFRVEAIRNALQAGRNFGPHFEPNELWFSRRLANLLAARFDQPWGRDSRAFRRLPRSLRRRASTWSLDPLGLARRRYYSLRPKMAVFDTGALIYEYLRYERGLVFAGLDVELAGQKVHHYGGVTRSEMFGPMPLDVRANDVENEVRDRLATAYSYRARN